MTNCGKHMLVPICNCGQNVICRNCGEGHGQIPCDCSPYKISWVNPHPTLARPKTIQMKRIAQEIGPFLLFLVATYCFFIAFGDVTPKDERSLIFYLLMTIFIVLANHLWQENSTK